MEREVQEACRQVQISILAHRISDDFLEVILVMLDQLLLDGR